MNEIADFILLSSGIKLDKKQAQVSNYLQTAKENLQKPKILFWQKNFQALYIWGKPGVGKTMLMDAFYQGVKVEKKRVHWHTFLKSVLIQQYRPNKDNNYSDNEAHFSMWLDNNKLLCFDEFHIGDAGNATLLSLFIEQAIQKKITLIITSNYHPDDLKIGTFQRHLIQGMIEMIKDQFQILQLDNNKDYRKIFKKKNKPASISLFVKKGISSKKDIFEYWNKEKANYLPRTIQIDDRDLIIEADSKNGLWVEFNEICEKSRSYFDYLSYAKKWKIIFISNIANVAHLSKDTISRFIWLIDIFYESKTCLILELPKIKELWFEDLKKSKYPGIKRCISRLNEMSRKEFSLIKHKKGI